MPRLRWKFIFYHIYSNLLAVAITIIVALFLLPERFIQNTGLWHTVQIMLGGFLASIIIGFFAGFNFSKNIRNRLEEVSIGARNLSYGNLEYRLPFTDDPEVGDIALAFNDMAERLEKQVAALQKVSEENEQLIQKTKLTAVSEERQRLARDLHDAISQQLFAISMMAASAAKLATKKPNECVQLISHIEESASKAQSEMRALLMQLRPSVLENQSLADAVNALAQELQHKQVIECELSLDQVDLPINIENQLYRVVQEGLSNVLRHANASKVTIKLSMPDAQKRLYLTIEDNGRGFSINEAPTTTLGLKSIRERIDSIGGTVNWISIPSKGTRLEVRIPLYRGKPQRGLGKSNESTTND